MLIAAEALVAKAMNEARKNIVFTDFMIYQCD
jgi:hypothetical protein